MITFKSIAEGLITGNSYWANITVHRKLTPEQEENGMMPFKEYNYEFKTKNAAIKHILKSIKTLPNFSGNATVTFQEQDGDESIVWDYEEQHKAGTIKEELYSVPLLERLQEQEIKYEPSTPLEYHGKWPGTPHRFYITDPNAPPLPTYTWRDSRTRKKMTGKGNWEGSSDDTVAYLDVFETKDEVYIAFVTVRDEYRKQGLAGKLIAHLYKWTDKMIRWGDLMHKGAEKLYNNYKKTDPGRTKI